MVNEKKSPENVQANVKDGIVRKGLAAVLLFVALNAFGGGYYGLTGAKAIPTEWLNGSPFANYLVPSLILFFIVGGSCLLAAITVFKRHKLGKAMALGSGMIMLVWISAQLLIIGYVSWMQPAIAITAFLVVALSSLLPKNSFG